jgi:hypothetical protein
MTARHKTPRGSGRGQEPAPPVLYHGSSTAGIAEFEPRRRYVPSEAIDDQIYATDLPAFAAAHSFPWQSSEGFDLSIENGTVAFYIPSVYKERLNAPAYIYKLPGNSFRLATEDSTGHTFISDTNVTPIGVKQFVTVEQAIQYFGGKVVYRE